MKESDEMEYIYEPEGVCSHKIIFDIENNIIKSMKISCVCEVLAEVDEFNDISDFCYLKKYIAELKKAKKLCKKHSINKYDGYGHKKFYYKCTKCRSVWALTEPDGNFNGRLEKL